MGSRRAAAVGLAALLVALSSGCWGQPGAGPGNTFFNDSESSLRIGDVATLEEAWSGRGGVSAVMSGKVVGAYWTGTGVDVVAHDVGTGAESWSRTLTPPDVVSGLPTHPPVVIGSTVWTGYQARTTAGTCVFGLARLDLGSGAVVGTDTTGAPTELVPFGDDVGVITTTYLPGFGDVCFPSGTLAQRIADGATGATEWTSGFAQAQAITVVGDTLFAYLSSLLRSYPAGGCGAPTCTPTWTTQPTGVGAINDLAGDSTGPLVAIAPGPGAGQLSLYAIDRPTGTLVGSTLLPFNASSLALANGTAYVAGDTTLAAFDVASCASGSCALSWSATLDGQATFANGLAVAGGVVYVGREDGVVEAFATDGCSAATCSSMSSVDPGDTVLQLAVSQGHLFVGTIDTVTAFAPSA